MERLDSARFALTSAVSPDDRQLAIHLVQDIENRLGYRPLSDDAWLALTGDEHRPVSLVTDAAASPAGPAGPAGSLLVLTNDGSEWSVELVTQTADHIEPMMLVAIDHVASEGGRVRWLVPRADAAALTVADSLGFAVEREVVQLRVQLPVHDKDVIDTRPFVVGIDEVAWLEANNAAFAWHPEQGGWDLAAVRQRETSDWFDADGFLLHEIDGRLAASCWTKVHAQHSPPLGEIYVISVHPDFQGRGLGRSLTVAGLTHLASRGIDIGMLYVDGSNTPAMNLYLSLGFHRHHADVVVAREIRKAGVAALPRWSVADVHESFESRTFTAAMERARATLDRATALFQQHGVRALTTRPVVATDAVAADAVIAALNSVIGEVDALVSFVTATTATNSFDQVAQGWATELGMLSAQRKPLMARLAAWVDSLGVDALALVSNEVAEHREPLARLSARATHQMSEAEEDLYSWLSTTGSSAWARLHGDVTSQLAATVTLPSGPQSLPMAAIRGLATHPDPATRRAAHDAELAAWPTVAPICAAALNAIKGEASIVNSRRQWASALDASLFANSVGRPAFDALQTAVVDSLPDFRAWLRVKAGLHGHPQGLPWHDLFAPLPDIGDRVTWAAGLGLVRDAFGSYGGELGGLLDRALDGRWIDAEPRVGKRGGAFCASLIDDRSLVFLNWSDSIDSTRTLAHELGHAYHNAQLAGRTPLQRQLPMALAETASIFCETLLVDNGLRRAAPRQQLALLDADLVGATQVVVDIHSRFLFESDVFQRRQRRTIGVDDLNQMMRDAQLAAYGDGIDQSTAHPFMWAVKPHYYSSHFYNWPYTFGLLFGLGLFAQYRTDPDEFVGRYDDLLSRVGMDSAEDLAAGFGIDIADTAFWTSSLDVIRERMRNYSDLAATVM